MKKETVLSRLADVSLVREPFAHVVIRNAVEDELASQLLNEYPSLGVLSEGTERGSNKRISYSAFKVFDSPNIKQSWKDFIQAHVSQDFFKEVTTFFAPAIDEMYPKLAWQERARSLGPTVIRKKKHAESSIALDAQICINTPVTGTPSSVRGAHVDNDDKLIAGLWYLRHPDDVSKGGDLVVYRWKNKLRPQLSGQWVPDMSLIESHAVVPYAHNTLVLFLNSPWAVHGVTPRFQTHFPRLFMNLVVEMPEPLFSLADYREPMTSRMMRFFRNRTRQSGAPEEY